MILSWMLYASLLSLLLGSAAWALEGVVRQRGWPVRGLWTAGLLGSLALPSLPLLLPERRPSPAPAGSAPVAAPTSLGAEPAAWTKWTEPLAAAAVSRERLDLDPWLLALWGAASLGIALALAGSYLSLARRRRGWTRAEVEGRTVWVSEDTGPAVAGFLPGRVVLPAWLLGTGEAERRMVLAHEEEHVRARDPALLLGALLLCVALPWNAGLWWIGRRIRRAVEIDCDQRVLARGVNARAYGRLLVEVSERGAAHRLMVAALSESPSFLERRIRVMLAPRPRGWRLRAGASGVFAAALVLVACQVDRPDSSPVPATGATYAVAEDGSLVEQERTDSLPAVDTVPTAVEVAGEPAGPTGGVPASGELGPFQQVVRRAVEEFYPNLLSERLPAEEVNLYFLADARGRMVRSAIDTEARSGGCGAILQAGLAARVDWKLAQASGCGRVDAGRIGPNRLEVYWASLKPEAGVEAEPGPYRFYEVLSAGRPPESDLRAALRRHHPEVLREGLPIGENLWFIADRGHRVLHTGRGAVYTSSRAAELDLEARYPGIEIGPVLMSGSVRAETGEGIGLVWATLAEPGAAPDSRNQPGSDDPALQIRAFSVTTPVPGREVRIRLSGEAAAEPGAFRIDGRFRKEGGDLVARTPFLFLVTSTAPFEASFSAAEGTVDLTARSTEGETVVSGTSVRFQRTEAGERIHLLSTGEVQVIDAPSAPAHRLDQSPGRPR